MPNWTTNYLACHEEDLKRIVNERGDVDFNLAMPMPEELEITQGSVTDWALQALRGENTAKLEEMLARGPFTYGDATCKAGECRKVSTLRELEELGARYAENMSRHGAATWYGWCTSNWGTKWNACDTAILEVGRWRIARFETAWSQPSPEVIRKAFEGSRHGFIFEAFDENYAGISCLGYESCEPVLIAEAGASDDAWDRPRPTDWSDLDFDGIAAEAISRYDL